MSGINRRLLDGNDECVDDQAMKSTCALIRSSFTASPVAPNYFLPRVPGKLLCTGLQSFTARGCLGALLATVGVGTRYNAREDGRKEGRKEGLVGIDEKEGAGRCI